MDPARPIARGGGGGIGVLRMTASGLWLEAGLELEAYTARQLVDASDGITKSRSRGCRPYFRSFDKREGRAHFNTSGTQTWRQEVLFEDWDAILEVIKGEEGLEDVEGMTGDEMWKDPTIHDLLMDSDILVLCSCPSYKYTFAYICYSLGAGELGEAINKPPNIRNPRMEGVLCKHLIAVCDQFLK